MISWNPTYIQKGTRQHSLHSRLQVRIGAHDRAVLPAQLHQTRLEILAACTRNLAADVRATGEVDLAHGWVLDHGIDDLGRILRRARQDV